MDTWTFTCERLHSYAYSHCGDESSATYPWSRRGPQCWGHRLWFYQEKDGFAKFTCPRDTTWMNNSLAVNPDLWSELLTSASSQRTHPVWGRMMTINICAYLNMFNRIKTFKMYDFFKDIKVWNKLCHSRQKTLSTDLMSQVRRTSFLSDYCNSF